MIVGFPAKRRFSFNCCLNNILKVLLLSLEKLICCFKFIGIIDKNLSDFILFNAIASENAFLLKKFIRWVWFQMNSFSSKSSKFCLRMKLFSALKCSVKNLKNFSDEAIGSYSWCSGNSSLAWSSRDSKIRKVRTRVAYHWCDLLMHWNSIMK